MNIGKRKIFSKRLFVVGCFIVVLFVGVSIFYAFLTSGEGGKWGSRKSSVASPSYSVEDTRWEDIERDFKPLDTSDPCNADRRIGNDIEVEGEIAEVQLLNVGTYFLNFGAVFPNQCLTGVIFRDHRRFFPDDLTDVYEGKMVRMKGKVSLYQGKPQIILEEAEQLKVLE